MDLLSPSSTTFSRKRSKTLIKEELNPSFADLTTCLLEVIMSHLVLKDNIRASATCKSWLEAAIFVRVLEKNPWLLCFPKRGNLFKLCDPLEWNLYTLELPELAKSTVCYSRDGWLLMRKVISNDVFFFNPFSRELINLPKCDLPFWEVAFSCPPTSDTCVLFAINHVMTTNVTFSTFRPGATAWITEEFPYDFEDIPSADDQRYMHSKLVYVNDRLYCYLTGSLYYFHPSSRTWNFHYVYTLESPYVYHKEQYGFVQKSVFLVEKKGEIFLVFTCGNEKPMVYKLAFRVGRDEWYPA